MLRRVALRILVLIRRLVVSVGLGVVIVSLLLAVGWVFSGGWVAARLSQLVNQRLFIDRSTRLVVGRVTGSLFGGVIFEKVELDRRIGDSWIPSVRAERVEARYNLVALLRRQRVLTHLAVTSPRIDVQQDPTGRWVLPVGELAGQGEAPRGGMRVRLEDIDIQNGILRVTTRDRGYEGDSLDLRARIDVTGSRVTIDVHQGRFRMPPPVGHISAIAGRLLVDGQRVETDGARFYWEGSSVAADFAYDPADSLAGLIGHLNLTRLPLGRLKGLIDTTLLPSGGEATGGIHVTGGRSGFDYRIHLGGRWGSWRVDSLGVAGRWEPGLLRFDRLRLATPLLDIADASGRLELTRGLRLAAEIELNHARLDSLPLKPVAWIPGEARGRVVLDVMNLRGGHGPTRGDIDVALLGDRAFGVGLGRVTGHINWEDDRDVRITGAQIDLAGGGQVTGEGLVLPGDRLDFKFHAATDDWAQLRPLIVIPGLAGSGEIGGRLIGTGSRPELDLSGSVTNAAGWEMAADSVRIVRLSGPFTAPAHLSGTVEAERLHALGRVLDHVEMDYAWTEPRLDYSRLDVADADTVVHTYGHSVFDVRRNTIHSVLADGTLSIGGLTWRPEGPVTIDGVGKRFTIPPVGAVSPAGRAVVEAVFQNDRGTVDSRFTEMDLDLVTLAGSRKAKELTGGRLNGALRLVGPVVRPDIEGRVRITDYRWADALVDSAYADFATRDATATLIDGWAVSGAGRLTASGAFDLPGHAWIVWNDWIGQRPVAFQRTTFRGLRFDGRDLDLTRWAAWNPEIRDLSGRGTGTATLDGTPDRPRFALDARLTGLRHGKESVDSLGLALHYDADRLEILGLHAARSGASFDLSGAVPVHLALHPAEARLIESPVDLLLDLPRTDLRLLPYLGRQLDLATGFVAGRLRIQGTRTAPRIFGDLTLTDGRFRLKGREELFESVHTRARFAGSTVFIDSLAARQGSEGRLTGRGTFELGDTPAQDYRLTFEARRMVVRQSGDYAVQFDGSFDVTPITLAGGLVRPMTNGSVQVSRAEIIRSLNRPQPTPEPGQDIYFRIAIDAPGRVFVVNDLVDMELSGNLTASKTPEGAGLTGDLEILKGYYSLLYRRFRITSGTLTFDKLDVIDPQIDITAETNAPDHTYRTLLTGRASQPVIHFESDPADLSEEEILNRLAPGATLVNQEGGIDTGEAAALGVNVLSSSVQALLSRVQRELAGKLGIIDELRLDAPSATDRNAYARITAARYLTPEINVSYSQGLGGSLEQGIAAEYRLGRLLFLHGEFIRRRPTGDDPRGEEYNVDLQIFHEY